MGVGSAKYGHLISTYYAHNNITDRRPMYGHFYIVLTQVSHASTNDHRLNNVRKVTASTK